jgi:hypothetical protein
MKLLFKGLSKCNEVCQLLSNGGRSLFLTFALPLEFGFVHQTKNNILLGTKVDLAI